MSSSVSCPVVPLLSDCAVACAVSVLLLPPCSLIFEVWKFKPAFGSPSLPVHARVLTRPVSSTKVPFVSILATWKKSNRHNRRMSFAPLVRPVYSDSCRLLLLKSLLPVFRSTRCVLPHFLSVCL